MMLYIFLCDVETCNKISSDSVRSVKACFPQVCMVKSCGQGFTCLDMRHQFHRIVQFCVSSECGLYFGQAKPDPVWVDAGSHIQTSKAKPSSLWQRSGREKGPGRLHGRLGSEGAKKRVQIMFPRSPGCCVYKPYFDLDRRQLGRRLDTTVSLWIFPMQLCSYDISRRCALCILCVEREGKWGASKEQQP
jgi:hypothetical protein